MLSDGPKPLKKPWEELVGAASMETDPEKLATILEEIFAALEERERTLPLPQNSSASESILLRFGNPRQIIESD